MLGHDATDTLPSAATRSQPDPPPTSSNIQASSLRISSRYAPQATKPAKIVGAVWISASKASISALQGILRDIRGGPTHSLQAALLLKGEEMRGVRRSVGFDQAIYRVHRACWCDCSRRGRKLWQAPIQCHRRPRLRLAIGNAAASKRLAQLCYSQN